MVEIPLELVHSYRQKTFRLAPGARLKSQDEAIEYVNQRGFIFFWPITGNTFPSLWSAVAGDRPVADAHDDPGHVTWGWKDALLGSQAWYYAKVLRKKSTMIAMHSVPYFYALSRNYGSPEEDYLTLYEQGYLTQEAKAIYETLLNQGALDTIALRKAARLSSRESDSRFSKALADLQADFKILPIAVAQAGAWRYAFVYDIVTRHFPEIIDQARFIDERQAYRYLTEKYFYSTGAAKMSDLIKLFGWSPDETRYAIDHLVHSEILCRNIRIENQPGEWIVLRELCPSQIPDQG
jgi:hypothetical protein